MDRSPRQLVVLIMLLSSIRCGTPPLGPALRIGINPWPGYELLYFAAERGLFEQHGLAVEVVPFGSLGDTLAGYERGQIDGMGCTLIELLQAQHGSARDPVVAFVADYSVGPDVVLGRDPVRRVEDLHGRRVGVESASLGIYMLARALQTHGMSPADVTVVPLDQSRVVSEISRGTLDAVVTYPPISVEALQLSGVTTLFSSREIPQEIIDVVIVDRSLLATRGSELRRFIRAWDAILAQYRRETARADALMALREGLSTSDFQAAMREIVLLDRAAASESLRGGRLESTIEQVHRLLRDTGQIQSAPFDARPLTMLVHEP